VFVAAMLDNTITMIDGKFADSKPRLSFMPNHVCGNVNNMMKVKINPTEKNMKIPDIIATIYFIDIYSNRQKSCAETFAFYFNGAGAVLLCEASVATKHEGTPLFSLVSDSFPE